MSKETLANAATPLAVTEHDLSDIVGGRTEPALAFTTLITSDSALTLGLEARLRNLGIRAPAPSERPRLPDIVGYPPIDNCPRGHQRADRGRVLSVGAGSDRQLLRAALAR
jgi:hypothetical protein